jgi:hypothetical protein
MNDLLQITSATRDNCRRHRPLTAAAHAGIPLRVPGVNEPRQGLPQKFAAARRWG